MKPIEVTAGVIRKNGKFLIAKRKKGKHLENKWEFPGGKVEENESHELCLKRELEEEFGVVTSVREPITKSVFDYGDRVISLTAYWVDHIAGDFLLKDHDEIKWIGVEEFNNFDFAEADLPIVEKILEN